MGKTAVIVIADTHIGNYAGLCPPWGIRLENGACIYPSKYQLGMWEWFKHFWKVFVPEQTQGCEKITVIHNGDMIDGNHHEAVDIVPSVAYQEKTAIEIFSTIKERYPDFRMIKGTEAHGGKSEQSTERIAEALKCEPEQDTGNHAYWQLWMDVGGLVFNFAHHIGVTSSAAYESSAPMRELVAAEIEAAQWGMPLPDVLVRSHRHRFLPLAIPSKRGRIHIVITPAWQFRTPHVERIDRMRMSHIGGVVLVVEDMKCQINEKIYPLPTPPIIRQ